jgi:asparagine synthetase B (glutamine-hydrolysing)
VLEPDRRVALAAVGERAGLVRSDATGVVVAFEGELFASSGVVQGVAAAVRVLRAYLESGPAIVPPDGSFTAAIWDPRTRELMLVTDHAGTRPLYVSADGRRVLAASELKALVAAGVAPKLDLTGFAEVAAYEQHLGGRTLLEGVELVRGGRIRTFPAGSPRSPRLSISAWYGGSTRMATSR